MRMRKLSRAQAYARTAVGLRGFLRDSISPDAAERIVGNALAERSGRLLTLLRDRVCGSPISPYPALLRHAGVTGADIEDLVDREGVESALARLAANGVYVTLDEFKGRRPIRRGSLELTVVPGAFDAVGARAGVPVRSGATRSAGTPTLIQFDALSEEAAHRSLLLNAVGYDQGPAALWLPVLPGSAGIANVLRYAKLRRAPERWFSHAPVSLSPSNPAAWQTQTVLRLGRVFAAPLPRPEYVPLNEADRVAAWVIDQLRRGNRCQVVTYVSSAVRVCAAATAAGARLDGALFVVIGEPLSASRTAAIGATGAAVTCTYSMTESGTLGCGCGDPAAPDDVHLLLDRAAVVQHPVESGGRQVEGLLVTTLSPHARKVMLNVETGDTGRLTERACACPYGRLGYTRHLDSITSYEKLTGEGMTYDAAALVGVIEAVLPARFGGTATDYQAIEEEGDDKLVHLTLLVSPRLGTIAEVDVIATVRAELQRGPAGHRLADLVWEQAGFLRVRRAEPIPTARGKLLPFQVARPADGGRAG